MDKYYNKFVDATRQLFEDELPGLFIGKSVLIELDDNRNVKLTIMTSKWADQFDKVQAELIHKSTGTITKQAFYFSDYLVREVKHPTISAAPYLFPDGEGVSWYGGAPSNETVEKLNDDIRTWMAFYEISV